MFSANKGSEQLSLDYMIEDRWEFALGYAELGTEVLLFSHPWNLGKGSHRNLRVVRSWREIVGLLMN